MKGEAENHCCEAENQQREKEEELEEAMPILTDCPSPGEAHSSTVNCPSTSKRAREEMLAQMMANVDQNAGENADDEILWNKKEEKFFIDKKEAWMAIRDTQISKKTLLERASGPSKIEECIDLLESMEDVPDNMYLAAVDGLRHDDKMPFIFLRMSELRRRAWLANLVP